MGAWGEALVGLSVRGEVCKKLNNFADWKLFISTEIITDDWRISQGGLPAACNTQLFTPAIHPYPREHPNYTEQRMLRPSRLRNDDDDDDNIHLYSPLLVAKWKKYRNKQTDRVDRQTVQSYSIILIYMCIYMSIIIQLTYLHTLYKSLSTDSKKTNIQTYNTVI